MYIAFKWLIGLSLTMWIAMCCLEMYLKSNKEIRNTGLVETVSGRGFYNITVPPTKTREVHKKTKDHKSGYYESKDSKQQSTPMFHYIMFFAGAVAVTVFDRKREIIMYTKTQIAKFYLNTAAKYSREKADLRKTATTVWVALLKFSHISWLFINLLLHKITDIVHGFRTTRVEKQKKLNLILIKKLKEIGEERKNLGQLLITAINENKNIRMQYQLEMMTKNRLVRHIENTQKLIKENRSRYVSFQHLYLVTHQENTFLKSRIKKLTKDKDEAEKNLMNLVNEIYRSACSELKTYCNRFIVQTEDNLLNADINAEIKKFLEKCRRPTTASSSNWHFSNHSHIEMKSAKSWPKCTHSSISEIIQEDEHFVPIIEDAPRLRGLPGEYVWTVKDKDGLIEKIFEYDYESDLDNGDTIRRIRQYSVYYDKDCLLDCTSSQSSVPNASKESNVRSRSEYYCVDYPLSTRRLVTGSEAFQKFLQKNNSIIPISRPPTPFSLCEFL